MTASKPWGLQLRYLYCQLLLLLPCLGSRELLEGQAVDCTYVLKSFPTNISYVQPCVTTSAGAPVVLDGSRRFESPRDGPRPVLDLAFKSSTVLLLPPGAGTEIVYANITGVRLAKLAALGVQLLLAVSVQPSASLLLTDVVLETDCSTLSRYQQWITEYRATNISTVDSSGDVAVSFWKQSGITLANCTITCRRPPAVVASYPPAGANGSTNGSETTTAGPVTVVSIYTDVDLYNALALAPLYGNGTGCVAIVVARNLTMSSPLWSAQGVELLRNVSIVGGYCDGSSITSLSNITDMENHVSSIVNRTSAHAAGKPVLDLQDIASGVYLADGVVLSLVDLIIVNTAMVFGYAPVANTGMGFVAPFLWFFDFKRTVVSPVKPLTQLVAIDCDIISYSYDVLHMWAWAVAITSTVEPIRTQMAPFKTGVYDLEIDGASHAPALEFLVLDAYGMLYSNSRLVPHTNSTIDVPVTSRGAEAPLYSLLIPAATTAVPVWTHSDLQNVLALAQRPGCSPYTNTTTYIHLFSNISLDGSKWPYAGYNISCNLTISGSVNREGGTWLNFNLLSRFITLREGATLTFRYLTLFNMPSQTRSYVLGDLTQMTLPMWPVGRSANSSLLLFECTIVLPYEEYRMLADVAGGLYRWSALNSTIKVNSIGSHSMSIVYLAGFSMVLTNTHITDDSGSVAYTALLGTNIYGTTSQSPSPSPPSPVASSSSATVAIAVAVPLGVVGLAAVAAAAFIALRRRHRTSGVNAESPGEEEEVEKCAEVAAPGAPGGPGSRGSKGVVVGGAAALVCAGASSNNTPHSECDASGATEGQAGEAGGSLAKTLSKCDSGTAPPLHVELHQLILDFAREIEDKHLTIHDALGSGGFATVYRGTWRGIDVAVKVVEFQDRVAGNERLQARAMTEAAIATNIQHSNIVTTYSYDIRPCQAEGGQDTPSSTLLGIGPGPEGGPAAGAAAAAANPRRRSGSSDQSNGSQPPRMWKLYLIQEFCEVGSLRVALENHMFQLPDGSPNMPMILRLMLDVVRGLQHLHRKNIVHGDLTPGNILLKADASHPGHYVAKLADFGLSVKMNPSQTSVDNNRTGTPFYASPEVRQHGNLTKASDVFALGVVLWEMWHGRPCYQRVRGVKHYIHASGYPAFPVACPASYADLAGRCLRRALDERPPLDEVHDVLRNLLGSAVSSGLSSGSDGCMSGSHSHEWPFLQNFAAAGMGPLGMGGGVGGGGVGGMGQGNVFVAAVAALGAGGAAGGGGGGGATSDASETAGDGAGTTGSAVASTNSWFPAALAAGFQAAILPQQQQAAAAAAAVAAAAAPGRAGGSGRGTPTAVAGSPPHEYACLQGGGAAAAATAAAQQPQQQLVRDGGAGTWPRGGWRLGHGPAGNPPLDGTAPAAIAQRTLPPLLQQQVPQYPRNIQPQQQQQLLVHGAAQPPRLLQGVPAANLGLMQQASGYEAHAAAVAPLPAPAALPRCGGAAEDRSRAGSAAQQAPRPWDVELVDRQQQVGAAGCGGGGGDGGEYGAVAPADPQPAASQARSSYSLKLGTAEHFVTAPGSNG